MMQKYESTVIINTAERENHSDRLLSPAMGRLILLAAVLFKVTVVNAIGLPESSEESLLVFGRAQASKSHDPPIKTVNVFPDALMKGAVGHTTGQMREVKNFRIGKSLGGCRWFGTAPICDGKCPDDYEQVRTHDGRCFSVYDKLFKDSCLPDSSFGSRCHFKTFKSFCCKRGDDCSWTGDWATTEDVDGDGLSRYCLFLPGELFSSNMDWNSCGSIKCSGWKMDRKKMAIRGESCDRVEANGLEGRIACGLITWHNKTTGQEVHKWYKS